MVAFSHQEHADDHKPAAMPEGPGRVAAIEERPVVIFSTNKIKSDFGAAAKFLEEISDGMYDDGELTQLEELIRKCSERTASDEFAVVQIYTGEDYSESRLRACTAWKELGGKIEVCYQAGRDFIGIVREGVGSEELSKQENDYIAQCQAKFEKAMEESRARTRKKDGPAVDKLLAELPSLDFDDFYAPVHFLEKLLPYNLAVVRPGATKKILETYARQGFDPVGLKKREKGTRDYELAPSQYRESFILYALSILRDTQMLEPPLHDGYFRRFEAQCTPEGKVRPLAELLQTIRENFQEADRESVAVAKICCRLVRDRSEDIMVTLETHAEELEHELRSAKQAVLTTETANIKDLLAKGISERVKYLRQGLDSDNDRILVRVAFSLAQFFEAGLNQDNTTRACGPAALKLYKASYDLGLVIHDDQYVKNSAEAISRLEEYEDDPFREEPWFPILN